MNYMLIAHDDHRIAVGDGSAWYDSCAALHPGTHNGSTAEHAVGCLVAAAERFEELCAKVDDGDVPRAEVTRRLAPIPWPPQLFGAPVNYLAHRGELGSHRSPTPGATTREMGLFIKASGSVIGPDDEIELPPLPGRETHYEGEVAVVIGRGGRDIPSERALDHIAGLTGALDLTLRLDESHREERSFRKSYRTFTPIGPALLPLAAVPDLDAVGLRLTLNGELRQQGTLSDLIVNVPELVAMASGLVNLRPGDVILTGTPSGVAAVSPGDEIELTVTGLPPLRLRVRDQSQGAGP